MDYTAMRMKHGRLVIAAIPMCRDGRTGSAVSYNWCLGKDWRDASFVSMTELALRTCSEKRDRRNIEEEVDGSKRNGNLFSKVS